MTEPSAYVSGDLRVDLRRMTVAKGGRLIALEPKSFEVLRFLMQRADRVVTKDELLGAVWAGTFLTPNALTRAVAQLRKAPETMPSKLVSSKRCPSGATDSSRRSRWRRRAVGH